MANRRRTLLNTLTAVSLAAPLPAPLWAAQTQSFAAKRPGYEVIETHSEDLLAEVAELMGRPDLT